MDYREYWQEVDAIAALMSDPDLLAEEYGDEAEPSDVLWEITDGHQFVIYTFKAGKVLEHSDNTDAYFDHVGEITADSWSAIVTPLALYAMQADVSDAMERLGDETPEYRRKVREARGNPSRARGRGRGRMGRRNFTKSEHSRLDSIWRDSGQRLGAASRAWRRFGNPERARALDRSASAAGGHSEAHFAGVADDFDRTRAYALSEGERAQEDLYYMTRNPHLAGTKQGRNAAPGENPPRDGKWHRVASGYALRGANQYVAVVPYKPRGQGTAGVNARRFAEVYEHQKGAKVPKGTKYVAALAWYGEPMMKILGAHKTLKAAKAAGAKAMGIKAPRRRARANAPNGAGAVVLVKSSARARPVRVKLPANAKPQKVGRVIVHRAVSYKGKKLRILKGWTVSTSSGRGVGRYKTKQSAMAAARRAR